jgi:long-chain acyl-CoA synthetase
MTQSRPWLSLYTGEPMPEDFRPGTLVDLFHSGLERDPSAPAIYYFDGVLSYEELDKMSDALTSDLVANGFVAGDRLGVYLQNMPQFVIASLAAWKVDGIVVTISPMSRGLELGKILPDCMPSVIVAQDELLSYLGEAIDKINGYHPRVMMTSARKLQSRNDERVLPPQITANDTTEMMDIIDAAMGSAPSSPPNAKPGDVAVLIYTSGTTGLPKGTMLSHANFVHNAKAVELWYRWKKGMGPVLTMAPLFHVSGFIHMMFAWTLGEAQVLNYRFHPEVMLETIAERRPSFAVSAITAYIALMNVPDAQREHFACFQILLSGGAPVPPAVIEAFERNSGRYVHNGYGMTETAAGVIAVPFETRAPVDPVSGTLSIGVPKYGVDLWFQSDNGERLPVGEIGELVVSGAAVSSGYWNKPDETAASMREDGFRTGDVGFSDEAGWVYLVDRKKDMISASGFKVWPREVEDVLYTHPAVREAGVTGVADEYRGETVRAIVSLKMGVTATPEKLISWCKERMSPYKVPREVFIIDELPKTASGKILRRSLRELTI